MSRYALHSRRNTVATGPALPRVESPLSELSGELSPDIRNTKIPAESSTASAQGSAPGPAASRVPASGNAVLRNPPSAYVQAEEEKSSPSDSEDDEDVSSQGNLTAAVLVVAWNPRKHLVRLMLRNLLPFNWQGLQGFVVLRVWMT
ncbi:uncharacterized protein EV420DRAFT_1484698 [Desarmillaria tabescens]|uniref:Uncharacterized protein n=1 Tax=Armillaria tabescens TaxID=1929756 RepID=A0AA39MSB1_ARMTA|nr:uncharacterized protein EV420DRAFT_1484698 [Desarmillaria tabescens]KAK0444199.1 hypothetical protein EV420DRAFT_1484698 [Desarmillaria tabescens]